MHNINYICPLKSETNDDGFTLMEMMVVIMIIGLLSGLIIPNLLSSKTKADQKKAVADIVTIENAVSLYQIDNSQLLEQDLGLQALVEKKEDHKLKDNNSYLKRLPNDPWHHPYHYDMPGKYDAYDIYSLGADNKYGGVGANRDIGTWNINDF